MIDDSAAVRGAICEFIGIRFKACPCEASDGTAAIQKVKEHTPDLVILALSLPKLEGVETASALRSMLPSTKIIGLGTYDGDFGKSQVAAAGFDVILSKEHGLAKLTETINALLPTPLN